MNERSNDVAELHDLRWHVKFLSHWNIVFQLDAHETVKIAWCDYYHSVGQNDRAFYWVNCLIKRFIVSKNAILDFRYVVPSAWHLITSIDAMATIFGQFNFYWKVIMTNVTIIRSMASDNRPKFNGFQFPLSIICSFGQTPSSFIEYIESFRLMFRCKLFVRLALKITFISFVLFILSLLLRLFISFGGNRSLSFVCFSHQSPDDQL